MGDAEVLAAVRHDWDDTVDRVEHLPVGFGAHHWAAYDGDRPRLFVTFDQLEPKRTAARLEAAYAGAAALREDGLEFVLAGRDDPRGPLHRAARRRRTQLYAVARGPTGRPAGPGLDDRRARPGCTPLRPRRASHPGAESSAQTSPTPPRR